MTMIRSKRSMSICILLRWLLEPVLHSGVSSVAVSLSLASTAWVPSVRITRTKIAQKLCQGMIVHYPDAIYISPDLKVGAIAVHVLVRGIAYHRAPAKEHFPVAVAPTEVSAIFAFHQVPSSPSGWRR